MTRTPLVIAALSVAGLACVTTETPSPSTAPPPAPPPSPSVTVAGPAHGARHARIDQVKLEAYVRSRGGIKACYAEELARDAGAHGRVLVRFTIGEAGDVSNVAVLRSELSPRLIECVTTSMSNWQTPFRPGGAITLEYPLIFAPNG